MSAALTHRGPDNDGTWCGGVVALGHRALHSLESASESQPVIRPHAGLALVADARIDNREELIRALGLPRAATDSDIILSSYEHWGYECAERLIGDFAFALWDGRAQRLLCARDPMGVKPFYYVHTAGRFAFATEIKAVLTVPGTDQAIDPEQVALFLGWHHEERTRTIYRDVMRLPAAHTLGVSRDGIVLQRYWTAWASRDVRFSRDEEYVEAFRDTFAKAVGSRLRSTHPVGATLSGGLDSSSVACMSRNLRGEGAGPLHTFSLIFPDLADRELRLIDERVYVDAAVRLGGLQPHFVRGDQLSPMRDARRLLWHLDEPYSTPNLYLHCGMYEAARANGVRVLLDGFDGDSAVSHGFGRLTGLARARQWDTLGAELTAFSGHHGKGPDLPLRQFVLPHLADLAKNGRWISWVRVAGQLARQFGVPRREIALGFGLRPLLPSLLRELPHVMRQEAASAGSILEPRLADILLRHERSVEREEARRRAPSERDAHVKALSQPLYQLTLEIADKAAAAYGVEPRYPFFDRRLIEFCVGLPEEQKFGGGWPRVILRRAMQGILPPEIQWRATKSNLSPNFLRQLRSVDLGEHDVVRENVPSPYLRADRLHDLEREYRAKPDDARTRGSASLLFRAAILEMWLDQKSKGGHRPPAEQGALSPAAA